MLKDILFCSGCLFGLIWVITTFVEIIQTNRTSSHKFRDIVSKLAPIITVAAFVSSWYIV